MQEGRTPKIQKKRTRGAAPSGTPRGWSFWAVTERCWREFLLKFICGLYPVSVKEPLLLGTIYHALLDNWAPEAIAGWGPEYAGLIDWGKKLYEARLKGPPLPKATASEKQHTLDFGMTSKPDREEVGFGKKPVVRDFKSAMFFSENDDKSWATNGGIIGEALAVGATKAIVDVINKNKDSETQFGRVQQFEVEVGELQREALEQAVADARMEINMRVDEVLAVPGIPDGDDWAKPEHVAREREKFHKALKQAFPKRLSSCVGRYGPCDYYERCWGTGPEKHLFEENVKRSHRWVKDEGDAELEQKVLKVKQKFKGVV